MCLVLSAVLLARAVSSGAGLCEYRGRVFVIPSCWEYVLYVSVVLLSYGVLGVSLPSCDVCRAGRVTIVFPAGVSWGAWNGSPVVRSVALGVRLMIIFAVC